MTQNLVKNIIGTVASSYQVNQAIEIPNITENYINSHIFIWYLQCLFKYMSRCWEVFLIGQIFFYSGGLGANRNVLGKLGMKLAIRLLNNLLGFFACTEIFLFFLWCLLYSSNEFLKKIIHSGNHQSLRSNKLYPCQARMCPTCSGSQLFEKVISRQH